MIKVSYNSDRSVDSIFNYLSRTMWIDYVFISGSFSQYTILQANLFQQNIIASISIIQATIILYKSVIL